MVNQGKRVENSVEISIVITFSRVIRNFSAFVICKSLKSCFNAFVAVLPIP